MTHVSAVYPQEETAAAAGRVADLLRALPRGDLPLRRVTWTAAEVGAHLVSLPRRYRRMIDGALPVPESLAADNERELATVPERDPAALAALLPAEVAALLDDLGPDGDRRVHYFTQPHTAAGLAGIMLGELLMHGWDLATATGRDWPIPRDLAAAALRGILPAIVVAVDPAVAAAATGVYHLHLRGADHWTFRVSDGTVTVLTGRPDRADLRLSADPSVFLRSGYGLVSSARAALTGGVIAYGRKPWLATKFSRLFAET